MDAWLFSLACTSTPLDWWRYRLLMLLLYPPPNPLFYPLLIYFILIQSLYSFGLLLKAERERVDHNKSVAAPRSRALRSMTITHPPDTLIHSSMSVCVSAAAASHWSFSHTIPDDNDSLSYEIAQLSLASYI